MTLSGTVAVVDDDALWTDLVRVLLEGDGLEVRTASDLASAREVIDGRVGVVILDQRLPDGDGLSLARHFRDEGLDTRVLMVTGHPRLSDAVTGLRLRIDDYLSKPVEPEVLRHAVLRSLETLRLERVERLSRRTSEGERQTTRLIGESMVEVRRLVAVAGASASPVLITGETGSGKGLVASAVHYAGPRSDRSLVKVNCAAIPDTLIEAELFGVERGAYTGAGASREGLFELADGGTLFLDEIGELEPAVQSKLLAVLEDGCARRVGSSRPRYFDVRVVTATNLDLETAVASGRFRQDLFYRLNVLRIPVPPLRERLGDLAELVLALLEALPGGRGARLAEGELAKLLQLPWPGNVRELRNLLERALLLDPAGELRPSRFADASATPVAGGHETGATLAEELAPLAEIERRHVLAVLATLDGNRTAAAKRLGIGVATLRRKLKQWNAT